MFMKTGVHEDPTTILTKILILLREMLVGLCSNSGRLISKGYLVQIWIVAGVGGTILLADSLYDIDANEEAFSSQLQRYRDESTKNEVAKDMTNSGYLQYEVAKRCGIQRSKLLPVYRLDSPDSCVAVIELVTAAPDTDFGIKELTEIQRHLKEVGLTTTNNVGYCSTAQHDSSSAAQDKPCSLVRSSWKGKEVQSNSDSQFYGIVEGVGADPSWKGKEVQSNSDSQFYRIDEGVGADPSWKGKEVQSNSDSQFYGIIEGVGADPSWKGKEVQSNSDSQFYVGSPSLDDKTPIVSARLKNPRRIRIFHFKSAFTIEELKRTVRNEFNWDENAGIKFDLHYVNMQNERVVLIENDDHVMELFGTHFVVIVLDVQLHEGAHASTKRNKIGRRRDGETHRRGVELDINGDGYKLAYDAVDSVCKPGDRDKMMQTIIDASPSKVKALRIEYCSPPSLDLDGRQKKRRRGESNSTLDETQHYSGGPRNMASVQGKTQDILMSAETTEQQLQPSNMEVISVEKSRAELDYVAPPVSASHMEENLSNMELQVSAVKTQGIMSTETTDGAEETTGHGDYIEPAAVSASQMEENDDIMVGHGIISAETTDGGEETMGHGAYMEPAAIYASQMEENDDIRVGHGIMSAETTDVAEETAGHGAYVEPATDSASQMEENDDIRVGHGIMSAETTDGAEETTGHGAYMEPAAVSASQMEEYYDITVGVGVDDQLVFYDGNGREFNASDHDRIGDISSTTTAPHVTYVEPAAVSSSHMKENEFPTAGAIGDYHFDWNVDGDFVNTNNDFGWDAVGLSNNDIVLGYDIWDY